MTPSKRMRWEWDEHNDQFYVDMGKCVLARCMLFSHQQCQKLLSSSKSFSCASRAACLPTAHDCGRNVLVRVEKPGWGMAVLTIAQPLTPPQRVWAVLNFRSGNETLIPKVIVWHWIRYIVRVVLGLGRTGHGALSLQSVPQGTYKDP